MNTPSEYMVLPIGVMPVSLFFHKIGPNLVQILLLRPHPLSFLLLILNKICQGIQLILIISVAIQ